MLEILLDSVPDSVNKSLGFAQALAKESLESLPADNNVSFGPLFYVGVAASGTGQYLLRK